jgi:hypothetical protein
LCGGLGEDFVESELQVRGRSTGFQVGDFERSLIDDLQALGYGIVVVVGV